MRSHLNPDRPRCCWCDAPFHNQADLTAHQLEHRGTAEEAAGALKQAADTGLTLQQAAERARAIADDLTGIDTDTARLDEQALRTLIEHVAPAGKEVRDLVTAGSGR